MGETSSQKGQIGFVETTSGVTITSSGDWVLEGLRDVDKKLEHFAGKTRSVPVQWDVTAVGRVDSAGMMVFIRYYDQLLLNDCTVEIIGASAGYDKMYRLLRQFVPDSPSVEPVLPSRHLTFVQGLGKITVSSFIDMTAFLSFPR